NENPVSRLKFRYRIACGNHLGADLMALNKGRPRQPVPLDDVTSAYAAGHHLHEEFSRSRPGGWDLFYPDIPVVIPVGDLHFCFSAYCKDQRPFSAFHCRGLRRVLPGSWPWALRTERCSSPYLHRPRLVESHYRPW